MRVLVVHTSYRYKGGEDMVVEAEAKLLASQGYEVEVYLFSNEGNPLPNLLQLPFNISSYFKMIKKIKLFKPDLVHLHNLHFAASPSVIYAVQKCKVPMVMTLHNFRLLCPSATLFFNGKLFTDSLQQSFPFSAVKQGVYRNSLMTFWMAVSMKLHQWLGTYRIPAKVIVLTVHAKKIFKQSAVSFCPDQLVVKPNFAFASVAGKPVRSSGFLYIGRLSEEKGIRVLLETFASTAAEIRIAGDGPLKELVQTYSSRYKNIVYIGNLAKDQVQREMSQAAALIFPSVWYEGMPLTIIEAYAAGLPVIASNLGAMSTMIEDGYNGLHFAPGDSKDLQLKIESWMNLLIEQQELYSRNAIRTFSTHYSPETNVAQLIKIYQSVVTGKEVPLRSLAPARENTVSV
jgi:glycosyltransferase involved in cell wall biosynthesis